MSEQQPTPNTDGTTGTPSSPPAPTAEPWRAGPNSPFAGKTAEEIHGLAMGQAYALEQANATLQKFNQPVPVQQHNAFDLDRELPDGEYAENAKVKDVIRRLASQGTPVDQGARQLAAQGLYANLRVLRADEYKRWGSEIDQEINKLPMDYWTLANLETIVNIVKSRHIDELAAEKAQRLVNESHPTIRSGSGGSGGVPQNIQRSLDSDAMPKGWVDKARSAGIDEATVREFCEITGQTPDQYLAEVEKYGKNGSVIRG